MVYRGQHSVGLYYPLVAVHCGLARINVLEQLVSGLCNPPYGFLVECNSSATVSSGGSETPNAFVLQLSTRPSSDQKPCKCASP
jgi:hypothetical protein